MEREGYTRGELRKSMREREGGREAFMEREEDIRGKEREGGFMEREGDTREREPK